MDDQSDGPSTTGSTTADQSALGNSDRRARETRRRFLDAGWDLLNELRLAELFDALAVDAIAARAERSERSFWNHFSDWQTYVDALVSDVPHLHTFTDGEEWLPIEVVREALEGSHRSVLPELITQATQDNWQAIRQPEEVVGLLRQLLLLSRVPTEPGLNEVLLNHYWGTHRGRFIDLYRTTSGTLGLEPLPPITWPVYARMVTALLEGNELLALCESDDSEASFLPMATALLALSMLRCVGSDETFETRTAKLLDAPSAPITALDDVRSLATACREAVIGADLSAGSPTPSVEPTLWSAVAEITGTPLIQLHDDLQRAEVIGALSFSTNLPLDVVSREDRGAQTQLIRAVDWLCELVRVARSDRWCAHSTLTERLREGEDRAVITSAVGLGAEFAGVLGEAHTSVHERVVNIALSTALSDDSTSPAEVASIAVAAHRGLSSDS